MSFNVCIYHAAGRSPWASPWLAAMDNGLQRHGIRAKHATYLEARVSINCDLAIHWGHRQEHIAKHQLKNGLDYLVLERGYVGDRRKWTSVGFNGLNNRAEFHAKDMAGVRWHKYFSDLPKIWKYDGNYILLIGQVEGDMSIKGRVTMRNWLSETTKEISKVYPFTNIKFRPHPLARQAIMINGTNTSQDTLEQDLANAKLCVTFNSNAGVDAILAGVPTVTMDIGSMVYDVTTHDLAAPPWRPGRQQWAYDIAYKQWRKEEIANGLAWEHLKVRYQ